MSPGSKEHKQFFEDLKARGEAKREIYEQQKLSPSTTVYDRLSPGFTATVQYNNQPIRIPLRFFSMIDGFGRLGLMFMFSSHDGMDLLKYWAMECYNEEDPSFLSDPADCVRNGHHFGYATDPMHDPGDRQRFGQTQVAFKPQDMHTADIIQAAVRAGVIAPLGPGVKANNQYNDMYAINDILSWELLEL